MTAKRAAKGRDAPVPILSIKNLIAGYGAMRILDGVSIDLLPGDLAIVIGPNGSGKSTTVKSVFGITTIIGGSIRFDGQELVGKKTHEIVRMGIGYVPQGRLVFDTLTVEENLEMGGYDLDHATLAQRKAEVMALFPILAEKRSQGAGYLSGGQQQMLSIGRALMRKPRLLLLDEPSLGLDPKTQQLIFSTIKGINKAGTAVLMVEQNAHQALRICTKAYVIESGKVAASGGPELAQQKRMKALYLGGE